MLPLVQMIADGREYSLTQMVTFLAAKFDLSDVDLKERIPSGRQTRFYNRVAWSTTHLKEAIIIETTQRGVFRITKRGSNLLTDNISRIDLPVLAKFPEYIEFRKISRPSAQTPVIVPTELENSKTPDEVFGESYQAIRKSLAAEILDTVKSCTPQFFEKLVVDLLVKMGYGGTMDDAGQAIGR